MNQRIDGSDESPENSGKDLSFEVLVARARAGDHEASGTLVENYHKYLLFLANEDMDQKLKTKVGASDAVQESMMHAQMNLNQFVGDSETEFKAWLRTILVNDIHKNRRKFRTKKRDVKQEVNIQEQSAVSRGLLDEQLTPSSEAIRNEKDRALTVAISKLTEEQQQVIHMRNFEELSFEEIGNRMNRSADAARKMWARTIEVLKTGLKSASPELIDEQPESDNYE